MAPDAALAQRMLAAITLLSDDSPCRIAHRYRHASTGGGFTVSTRRCGPHIDVHHLSIRPTWRRANSYPASESLVFMRTSSAHAARGVMYLMPPAARPQLVGADT